MTSPVRSRRIAASRESSGTAGEVDQGAADRSVVAEVDDLDVDDRVVDAAEGSALRRRDLRDLARQELRVARPEDRDGHQLVVRVVRVARRRRVVDVRDLPRDRSYQPNDRIVGVRNGSARIKRAVRVAPVDSDVLVVHLADVLDLIHRDLLRQRLLPRVAVGVRGGGENGGERRCDCCEDEGRDQHLDHRDAGLATEASLEIATCA